MDRMNVELNFYDSRHQVKFCLLHFIRLFGTF